MSDDSNQQPSQSQDQSTEQEMTAPALAASEPTVYAPEAIPPTFYPNPDIPPPPPPDSYTSPSAQQQTATATNPYETASTASQPSAAPRKKSRRGLWISLVIVAVILVAGAVTGILLYVGGAPARAADAVVQNYYNAVEQQDYSIAYTYLDSQQYMATTTHSIILTRPEYTLTARLNDQTNGRLTNYTITNTTVTDGTATVTVQVTRNGVIRTINLQLQQVDNVWEIDQISQVQ